MSDNTDEQVEPAAPEAEAKKSKPRPKRCKVIGCDAQGKHPGTGLCTEHYRRYLNAVRAGAL